MFNSGHLAGTYPEFVRALTGMFTQQDSWKTFPGWFFSKASYEVSVRICRAALIAVDSDSLNV